MIVQWPYTMIALAFSTRYQALKAGIEWLYMRVPVDSLTPCYGRIPRPQTLLWLLAAACI